MLGCSPEQTKRAGPPGNLGARVGATLPDGPAVMTVLDLRD